MRAVLLAVFFFCGPAFAQSAAHHDLSALAELRGEAFEPSSKMVFSVETGPIGGPARTLTFAIESGPNWAAWFDDDNNARLVDFRTNRIVMLDQEAQTQTNTSLYAEARQRLDIYTALSQGGTAEIIDFGEAGQFDRFWLEAAMGIAPPETRVEVEGSDNGWVAYLENQLIFSVSQGDTCAALPDNEKRALITALRHITSLHPEITAQLRRSDIPLCQFSFVVFSPDSSGGRMETWTRTETDIAEFESQLILFDEAELALPRPDLTLALSDALLPGDEDAAPDPISFFETISQMRAIGDMAGALLVTYQESLHFGPCPSATVGSDRLACVEAQSLAQSGIGDREFEQAAEGMQAAREGNHPGAIRSLESFIDRDDMAGAAARVLVANALIGWGEDGLMQYPHLDPAELLGEAMLLDPYATEIHAFYAQRFLAAGAPHAAWTLFDRARSIEGRAKTPNFDQVAELESYQRNLMPDWFAPATDSPQGKE